MVSILYHFLFSIMSLSDIKWYVCLFIVEWISPQESQASAILHWILAYSTEPGVEWVK